MFVWVLSGLIKLLIKKYFKKCKNAEKNKIMIRGIHSFNKKLKMKIDVFPRGCFKQKYFNVVMVNGHKFQKLAKATRNSGLLVIVIFLFFSCCICDVGPILNRHWLNVSCLLGNRTCQFTTQEHDSTGEQTPK